LTVQNEAADLHKVVRAVAFDFGHTLVDERFSDGRTQLMPGVREVLPQLHQPMAVWANTRAAGETELRRRLHDAQLEQYFSCVVTSIDAGFRKPTPEFFQFALARWNFDKDDVLFVCNQLNTDVLGAGRYGIRTAWLSGPEFRSDDETMTLADAKPSFILSDLLQLPLLLETIAIRASSSA
jgi:HAD superfamily hydrolase (TIGR01509 family)